MASSWATACCGSSCSARAPTVATTWFPRADTVPRLVQLVAAVGVAGLGGPRSAGWTAVALAVALLVPAAGSASRAAALPAGRWDNSPLDGVGGVLCLPWAWALVAAG